NSLRSMSPELLSSISFSEVSGTLLTHTRISTFTSTNGVYLHLQLRLWDEAVTHSLISEACSALDSGHLRAICRSTSSARSMAVIFPSIPATLMASSIFTMQNGQAV